MQALEIARRLAQLGETEDAQKAYLTALRQNDGADPATDFEAALYLFHTGYDYRVSYTVFQRLYNEGYGRGELLDLMTQAFYAPNVETLEKRYRRNCRLLEKYPYFFRQGEAFPEFDDLPVKFFPYDDNGYLPFDIRENRFGDYVAPGRQVVSRNFFADLEKPILAAGVFSQYELEYLNDNVRKSEWCARENHIYLHYPDWTEFCCWLQVLDLKKLLEERKFVLLIGEALSLYPIDFKEKYGIDYGENQVKPFGVREINKVIWHTQLSFHNGGDFFNEIFDAHPNLLAMDSRMTDSIFHAIEITKASLKQAGKDPRKLEQVASYYSLDLSVVRNAAMLRDLTDKDVLVAIYLGNAAIRKSMDKSARIVPALFFQPHKSQDDYTMELSKDGGSCIVDSEEAQKLYNSGLIQSFKYIKTFTPIRRPTTSYAASNRNAYRSAIAAKPQKERVLELLFDNMGPYILNRSFMPDWQDRLFMDARLVRFEDAKLNPKATFTRLAAFLDLPYTKSMEECTGAILVPGFPVGFETTAVFNTYDGFTSDNERYLLEYFMRDVYQHCGYDFHNYDGGPMDEARVDELIAGFHRWRWAITSLAYNAFVEFFSREDIGDRIADPVELKRGAREFAKSECERNLNDLKRVTRLLLEERRLVNRNGQPLRFMELIWPDPALMVQPLYH